MATPPVLLGTPYVPVVFLGVVVVVLLPHALQHPQGVFILFTFVLDALTYTLTTRTILVPLGVGIV